MAFNIYEWRRNQLITENEEKSTVVTKTIKTLTFKDVDGLALPTKVETVFNNMVLPQSLDRWKKEFSEKEQELKVTIDKNNKWDEIVKIEGITQSDPMGFQAKIDAEKGKKPSLDEMGGDKKMYGIEKNSTPYDFGPYTYEEAKAEAAKLTANNPRNVFQPKPLSNMEDDLPAIDRMGMPGRSSRGMSSGDLGDY
jgi:hypothetical protein